MSEAARKIANPVASTTATAMAPAPKISIIVPCYNEEGAIDDTVPAICRHAEAAGDFELIMVDDGSQDLTADQLSRWSHKLDNLRVIRHGSNRGYGAALKSGIAAADADLIVIVDADGTYPLAEIPNLIAELDDRTDMVVGSRTGANVNYPFIRKIPKFFLKKYASFVAGQEIPDINSGLRVFRKPVAQRYLNILPDGFSFTTTITLALLTKRHHVKYVPIDYSERIGKSKIRPIHDTINFFALIMRTATYFAPLRVFLPFAMALGLASLASLLYDALLFSNLSDKTVVLFLFAMNSGMFALLADMIDKRGT